MARETPIHATTHLQREAVPFIECAGRGWEDTVEAMRLADETLPEKIQLLSGKGIAGAKGGRDGRHRHTGITGVADVCSCDIGSDAEAMKDLGR